MPDRGIIFSAPMVKAIQAGRKTQTRRLASSPLRRTQIGDRLWVRENCRAEEDGDNFSGVRYLADEAWRSIENTAEAADAWLALFHYRGEPADRNAGRGQNVPSIHMPRWASRLTLIVTDVRRQRLQQMDEGDCIAEGAKLHGYADFGSLSALNGPMIEVEGQPSTYVTPRWWFRELWSSLHGKPGERWDDNPEVVALSFEIRRGNIGNV